MTSRSRLLGLICSCTLLAASVTGCTSRQVAGTQESSTNSTPQSSAAVAERLRPKVAAGRLSDLRWPDFRDYQADVLKFYEAAGYSPAWIQGQQPTSQALAMIKAMQGSDARGLDPEDYDASRWASRIAHLASLKSGNASDEAASFDLAMTICVMRYIAAIHVGRVNPSHFDFGINVADKKYDLPLFLSEKLVGIVNIQPALDAAEPPFHAYQRTKQALLRYLDIERQGTGLQPLPLVDKPIAVGGAYAGAAQLAKLLTVLGDLPSGATAAATPPILDQRLSDALKHFQQRHGVAQNGLLTRDTLAQLNVPISSRVHQLQDALERYRWLPPEFAQPPLVVNIPEFRLRAFAADHSTALRMNVIVGGSYKHQTPVFTGNMKYIIFRPYWNVPISILRSEIVPSIQKNRMYLAKKGFEVTTSKGEVIPSAPVSNEVLQRLRSGSLMVREKSGDKNSLGLVKFIFPNVNDVYLHGTPSQALFARSRRDFSHGCIRVEDPPALAAWVLRDRTEWTLDAIKSAMDSGRDNQQVNLAAPIPVLILYVTAVAEENGETWFFDDIYGLDSSLDTALAKGYPYPG